MRPDQEIFRIESPSWLAELCPSLGGNLLRLLHKPLGLELLRSPDSLDALRLEPERYGIPVLMPPNRIDGGRFRFEGKSYELPLNEPARGNHLHGLALGRPWSLEEAKEGEGAFAKLSFTHDEGSATFAGFPCKFRIVLEYRFLSDCVEQLARVANLGDAAMPFGLGFHTAFALPASDARLWISAGDSRWDIEDSRKLPTGRLAPWGASCQGFHLPGGQEVEPSAISIQCPMADSELDGRPFRGAVLESRSRGVRIVYGAGREYGQWCVWNDGGGKGFVCVEPLTSMANAFNLELPASLTGASSIGPGCEWSSKCLMAVEAV